MAVIVFWMSFWVLFYVYIGYPLVLVIWKKLASGRRITKGGQPTVSLIVTAHNEARTLRAKLANCLELDYPRNLMEVIVSLDGSSDGSEHVAREYQDHAVVLFSTEHRGKAAAINAAAAEARGEILVFVDARQRLEKECLRHLVANFQDPSVGAASGELVIDEDAVGKNDGEAVGAYWMYEKCLRQWESEIHSPVGSTGALHAVRRSLFRPLPEDTILDDVAIPMAAVLEGKRVVFESRARVHDRPSRSPQEEFGRKVRTLMGNYQLMAIMPSLLLPWRNDIFFQFTSHKVARLLAPYFLVLLFVSNLFLSGWFYRGFLLSQIVWYGLAFTGYRLVCGKQRRFGGVPMYSTQKVEESK